MWCPLANAMNLEQSPTIQRVAVKPALAEDQNDAMPLVWDDDSRKKTF